MIKVTITWADGTTETFHRNSFGELFAQLQTGKRKYKKLFAREVEIKDMRQGRCSE